MIYVCKFPFGATQLNLKTIDLISDSEADQIAFFIEDFQKELNHNLINSSAYKFNEAQVNFPIFSKSEFIDFLKMNVLLSRDLGNSFNSFLGLEKDDDLEDLIDIDEDKALVTKKKDIALNTSLIKSHYILDILLNFLAKELNINNFLIETPNIFIAFGPDEWQVKTEELGDVLGLKNEVLLVEEYDNSDSKNTFKFGNIDEPVDAKKLILIGKSAIDNKVKHLEFPKLKYINDFHKHAKMNKINFAVIDSSNKVSMFVGS